MAIATHRIDATPDPTLMLKLGDTGYSLEQILAELIDNSIDARREKVVNVHITVDQKRVIVEDDATGMSRATLESALTIAKSDKKEGQLGMYGMGLKASVVALGNKFTIETTQAGSKQSYKVAWDADAWVRQGTWSYELQTARKHASDHGTRITVEKLKFAVGKRIGVLRNDLGRRFGPFISSGQLVLRVNGVKCTAPQIELMPPDGLRVKNPTTFELKTQSGHMLKGWVGLAQNSSMKGLYGFNTFRRGRMITLDDKIGFVPHPTTARIVGEVHMDHVPVTSNKREWIKTDALYDDAVAALEEFIKPFVAESRRLSSGVGSIRAVDSARLKQFKEGLIQALQSKALKDFTLLPTAGIPSDRGTRLEPGEAPRQAVDGEGGRTPEDDPNAPERAVEAPDTPTPKPVRNPDPTNMRPMKIAGRKFDFTHQFGNMGIDAAPYVKDWNPDTRQLTIVSNLEHPIFLASKKDKAMLAFLHVVASVAELVCMETQGDLSRYIDVRNVLQREASMYVAELK